MKPLSRQLAQPRGVAQMPQVLPYGPHRRLATASFHDKLCRIKNSLFAKSPLLG